MQDLKKKAQNLWYYYKVPILIGLAVLAAVVYMSALNRGEAKPDYQLAIVSPEYYSDAQIDELEAALAALGTDRNGDGVVTVEVARYRLTIGSPANEQEALAGFDADLVGRRSGIYLLAEPEAVYEAVAAPLSAGFVLGQPIPQGLTAVLREDHPERADYEALLMRLQ